jgi:hypothetical protein
VQHRKREAFCIRSTRQSEKVPLVVLQNEPDELVVEPVSALDRLDVLAVTHSNLADGNGKTIHEHLALHHN